jgi:hypothetical protein
MRTIAGDHPGKDPGAISYVSNGRYGLHRYWTAVFRYNDAIDTAARSGALILSDRVTSLPLDTWRVPSKDQCVEWERAAISPCANELTAVRRAVEIMDAFGWPLLAPHFENGVVVSLASVDTWAVITGIAAVGAITELLAAAEAESSKRRQITVAAIEAEKRGEKFDFNQWQRANQQFETGAPEDEKLPATANGKLAVEAAKLLECQLGETGNG